MTGKAAAEFGQVDILVHAIGFANREELTGPYYRTSRAGFHTAMDISVYSFTALAQAFQPYLARGASLADADLLWIGESCPGIQYYGGCQGGVGVIRALSGV